MADSDYDRDDDRRRDDRDDDRPRRRRDDDDRPAKKKGGGMVILFVILGVVLLLCVLPCGLITWWGVDVYNKMTGTAETFLAKVGAGDFNGAYSSTTASYKQKKTLEQFTADMKAAKLDTYQAKSFTVTASNSANTTHNLTGTATTSGGPVTVTVVIEQGGGGFDFTVADVIAPGIGTK
jgi:flagellar basal body-associated protein FliL